MTDLVPESDREAWLAARMQSVGGSEVAAMLGACKYTTREQLCRVKAGLEPGFTGNEATELGTYMEPVIAQIARDRWGWQMTKHGVYTRDELSPRLSATPDYTMPSPYGMAVVQIKNTTCQPPEECRPRRDGSPSTAAFAKGAPLNYRLQIQAELAVTGYRHGVLLALHLRPLTIRAYYVPREERVIALLRREVRVFWSEVELMKEEARS